MEISNPKNKEKVAVVVVGYSRLNSIKRLLSSLIVANYPKEDVPLVISLDCSHNEQLYEFARNFLWPYGNKYLIIHKKRLGLKAHIFSCGDLTNYFNAIILLEDDLYVSTEFYKFAIAAVEKYNNSENIAGISLYRHEFNGFAGFPFTPLNDGSDSFAIQTVVSWGQCWTRSMWESFRNWLCVNTIDFTKYDIPQQIKTWERAWSKYYYAYILACNKYYIFPYISLSTNFGDAGEHGDGGNSDWQVDLLNGPKNYFFKDFESMVKYDVYLNNAELHHFFNINKNNICIDLYGNNQNTKNKRYWLSVQLLPFKVEKKFALNLRPPELNIIKEIEGNDIFLYDTFTRFTVPVGNNISLIKYYIRSFNKFALLKYLLYCILKKFIKSKL